MENSSLTSEWWRNPFWQAGVSANLRRSASFTTLLPSDWSNVLRALLRFNRQNRQRPPLLSGPKALTLALANSDPALQTLTLWNNQRTTDTLRPRRLWPMVDRDILQLCKSLVAPVENNQALVETCFHHTLWRWKLQNHTLHLEISSTVKDLQKDSLQPPWKDPS